LARIDKDIQTAIDLLKQSELVSIPTETVYGLAGNAYDVHAIAKIFEVKERPTFDPLIVHTSSMERLMNFVEEIPAKAHELGSKFWPGPLTLIMKKKQVIPDLVTSGLANVAVRIPNHPLTLKLLENIDFPLAAPSANPFGYVSPTKAGHVNHQLGNKIKYILDGGNCQVGIESTIVAFDGDEAMVLRLGGCKIEDIEKQVGKVKVNLHTSSNPSAPGMLESHYAPATPLIIGDIEQLIHENSEKKIGILSFYHRFRNINADHQFVLSKKADLEDAATRLFTGLRYLDTLNLQLIITEYVPDEGLGRAINDRLTRAELKRS
jgi:L-threonylcarbamoyladenylate synthase